MDRRSFLKRVAAAPVAAAALPSASSASPPPARVPDGTVVFGAAGQVIGVVEGDRVIEQGRVSVKIRGLEPGPTRLDSIFN